MRRPRRPQWLLATMVSTTSAAPLSAAPDNGGWPGSGHEPARPAATWRDFDLSTGTADFYVDDASESIQDAIDAADDGDIIVLGSDTWDEALDFQGKAIWLIGNGQVTLRRALSEPIAFQQLGSEGDLASLRLSNLTLTGSTGSGGQGLVANYTILELDACTFQDWSLDMWTSRKHGAAIQATDCQVSIRNCAFDTCVALHGGAIKCYRSDVEVDNSRFTGCAAALGGALEMRLGALKATRSTFELCTADKGGAIALIGYTEHTVSQCRFDGNQAENALAGSGGAIYHAAPGGFPIYIDGCAFTNNTADSAGAIAAVNIRIDRCLFEGNQSTHDGWDIRSTASIHTATHSRFCGNTSAATTTDEEGRTFIRSGDDRVEVSQSWMGPTLTCHGCDQDLQFDGRVGISELLWMLEDWGMASAVQDADGDLQIGLGDLTTLLADWGACEGYVFDGGTVPFGGTGGLPF